MNKVLGCSEWLLISPPALQWRCKSGSWGLELSSLLFRHLRLRRMNSVLACEARLILFNLFNLVIPFIDFSHSLASVCYSSYMTPVLQTLCDSLSNFRLLCSFVTFHNCKNTIYYITQPSLPCKLSSLNDCENALAKRLTSGALISHRISSLKRV